MCNDFEGFFLRAIVGKRKITGTYEKLYVLRDLSIGQRIVGIFDEDYKATRYWDNEYIPSKRCKIQENPGDHYELDLDKLTVFYEGDV